MEYFLDTSIQYTRMIGHSNDREQIKRIIDNNQVKCSRYVLMEFKRGFLQGLVLFHSYIKEESKIEDAYARFSNLYSGREKTIMLGLTGLLIREFPDKYSLLRRLERYIEWELIDNFENGIEYIEDKIKCSLSTIEPVKIENYAMEISCKKTDNKCDLQNFMRINKKRLKILLEKSQESSAVPNLQKLSKLYEEILKDYNEAKGNNCKTLGDNIIALECPKKVILLTTDSFFETLGSILNKEVKKLSVTK